VRLRLGITLWLLSWVPYGLILGVSGLWFTVTLGFEIVLGIVGLALAGSEFGVAVKQQGWKGAPRVAWRAMRHGESVAAAE
jgi:hypothetical protein